MNYELFYLINQLANQNSILDTFMIYVTNGAIFIYGITLVLLWFINKHYRKVVIYAGFISFLTLLINFIIRKVYVHPRPFVNHEVQLLIDHAANNSFPSNHTSGAFALSIAVFLFHRKLGSFLLLLAVFTGFSRIFVGHHYPFDILASILIASTVGALVYMSRTFLDRFVQALLNLYDRLPILGDIPTIQSTSSTKKQVDSP
ncbi:hypothetical protein BEP19_10760 [Ammoniphilus oxalaticus]|uniref:Phosphatidic acid phosphatase type 2/haloperoxidase domain-containing protein n=1 Tax=Ammoniphilus oxalaticus TaxID=66863 RepID=A0A419SG40_9BACL|nr:undecaprenyl-diphosphatase [Ammoniphilus oxalaticus]RKD22725.1 hypothetical protein BEP19_10760 [Ammoniphilus oxalaticus]